MNGTLNRSGLMVFQIQLAKRLDAVPLKRDCIADREAALRWQDTLRRALRAAAE